MFIKLEKENQLTKLTKQTEMSRFYVSCSKEWTREIHHSTKLLIKYLTIKRKVNYTEKPILQTKSQWNYSQKSNNKKKINIRKDSYFLINKIGYNAEHFCPQRYFFLRQKRNVIIETQDNYSVFCWFQMSFLFIRNMNTITENWFFNVWIITHENYFKFNYIDIII